MPIPAQSGKEPARQIPFFIDQRAGSVGDILTVKIVEVSTASEKASYGYQ